MSQHTPGPWIVGRQASNGDARVVAQSMSGETVARILRSNRQDGDANARLIAKAPEMLRLLTILANDNQSLQKMQAAQSNARALLREIEGQP